MAEAAQCPAPVLSHQALPLLCPGRPARTLPQSQQGTSSAGAFPLRISAPQSSRKTRLQHLSKSNSLLSRTALALPETSAACPRDGGHQHRLPLALGDQPLPAPAAAWVLHPPAHTLTLPIPTRFTKLQPRHRLADRLGEGTAPANCVPLVIKLAPAAAQRH